MTYLLSHIMTLLTISLLYAWNLHGQEMDQISCCKNELSIVSDAVMLV